MKKLMIAAASAALIGGAAQAKLCDVEGPAAAGCSVYNVKFTFRTLAARNECKDGAKWLYRFINFGQPVGQPVWYRTSSAMDQAAKRNAGNADVETINYLLTSGALAFHRPVYWMDNATRRFDGILWQCESACFEGAAPWDLDHLNLERINFAMWEKRTQLPLTFPIAQIKFGKPADGGNGFANGSAIITEYATFNEEQNFRLLGRYGKSAQKVAAFWNPSILGAQAIAAAGFGSFDAKNLRIKSISGNAVGMISPLNELGEDACGHRAPFFCALGFMCTEWRDWCCDGCYAGVQLVPASGTWSLKFNSSATKKANNDKLVLADLVPAYMLYSNSRWEFQQELDPNLHSDYCYWIANEESADKGIGEGAFFFKGNENVGGKKLSKADAIDRVMRQMQNVFEIAEGGVYFEGNVDQNVPAGYLMQLDNLYDEEGKVASYVFKLYKTTSTGALVSAADTLDVEDAPEGKQVYGYHLATGTLVVSAEDGSMTYTDDEEE